MEEKVALILIIIPLLFLILLNLPIKNLSKVALWTGLLLCIIQFWLSLLIPLNLWNEKFYPSGLFNIINLYIDNLTLVLLVSISIVSFISLLVGQDTIQDENKKFNFINLVIIALIGMNGLVMVTDLFSLYVFLEIVGVSSFILIALNKDKEGLEGAFKYLMLSAVATIMMLSSIGVLLLYADGTSFSMIKIVLCNTSNHFLILCAICVFIGGLLIKAGLIPFHGWLPDAYSSAPHPVSILLAGIVTKSTGVYALLRIFSSIFILTTQLQQIILFIGALSIIIGAILAIGQKDFKRMLAYSSISQVGYIIIGLGAGTKLGFAGAVFHLFNHAIFKSQLFVNAAAVEQQTGKRDMDELGGIAEKMPATGITSIIGFLSAAGIPPLSGFWSKLIILIALWTSNHKFYTFVAIIGSLITLAYFLSMQRRVFFGKVKEGLENTREASVGIVIAAVLLAAITIGIGIFFPFVLNSFILPVQKIF